MSTGKLSYSDDFIWSTQTQNREMSIYPDSQNTSWVFLKTSKHTHTHYICICALEAATFDRFPSNLVHTFLVLIAWTRSWAKRVQYYLPPFWGVSYNVGYEPFSKQYGTNNLEKVVSPFVTF